MTLSSLPRSKPTNVPQADFNALSVD